MKFLPPLYVEGSKQISHKDIPGPFYSTTSFTDRLLGFLGERDESKPFFAYLPYTAPHCEYSSTAHRQLEECSR
jgi:arylsulfatase